MVSTRQNTMQVTTSESGCLSGLVETVFHKSVTLVYTTPVCFPAYVRLYLSSPAQVSAGGAQACIALIMAAAYRMFA